MKPNVLVAYASKHGSTTEIAERIGAVLRSRGFRIDVRDARDLPGPEGYEAVVLGSAVYAGSWMKEAAAFLHQHQARLREVPCWIFSSGPTGEDEPKAILDGWAFPKQLESVLEDIQPRDVVLFHGSLDPDKLNLFERLVVRGVKAPFGDFRDFHAIDAWAAEIADELSEAETPEVARA